MELLSSQQLKFRSEGSQNMQKLRWDLDVCVECEGGICFAQHAAVLHGSSVQTFATPETFGCAGFSCSQANRQYLFLPDASEAGHSFSCMSFLHLAGGFLVLLYLIFVFVHTVHVGSGSIYMGLFEVPNGSG